MTFFLAGLIAFLGIHSVSIVAPRWRDAQANRMGANRWRVLYSLMPIASLAALIYGFAVARSDSFILYQVSGAMRIAALFLMLPVFPLLIATYLPSRIKRVVRHPMLLAVVLWAASHLLAEGTLNDVILFSSFLCWSAADMLSVKKRKAVGLPAAAPASATNDVTVVVGGLALYAFMLLWAHARLIGISPL